MNSHEIILKLEGLLPDAKCKSVGSMKARYYLRELRLH